MYEVPWIGAMDALVVRAANESRAQMLGQALERLGITWADARGALGVETRQRGL